jgi:hypothetical protein
MVKLVLTLHLLIFLPRHFLRFCLGIDPNKEWSQQALKLAKDLGYSPQVAREMCTPHGYGFEEEGLGEEEGDPMQISQGSQKSRSQQKKAQPQSDEEDEGLMIDEEEELTVDDRIPLPSPTTSLSGKKRGREDSRSPSPSPTTTTTTTTTDSPPSKRSTAFSPSSNIFKSRFAIPTYAPATTTTTTSTQKPSGAQLLVNRPRRKATSTVEEIATSELIQQVDTLSKEVKEKDKKIRELEKKLLLVESDNSINSMKVVLQNQRINDLESSIKDLRAMVEMYKNMANTKQ